METTDGKYIGLEFDTDWIQEIGGEDILMGTDGVPFKITKTIDVGGGYWQYSNSHYVIVTKEV